MLCNTCVGGHRSLNAVKLEKNEVLKSVSIKQLEGKASFDFTSGFRLYVLSLEEVNIRGVTVSARRLEEFY